ncbi:MAG: TIGR01212 family radical SAM protein [Clostridia bacterium]|nr:TIGR01212 family radical SAM protein [Clostridia bacterium]
MYWENKRYNALGLYLKNKFNKQIIKLSLDAGFTCPNRDGTLSTEGCIYCSPLGSGDFAASRRLDLYTQLEQQMVLLKNKWPNGKYIAYFQNYTNTYAPINELTSLYNKAISHPNVIGLAIATRPDCLPDETIDLLSKLNKKTFLWVELGLQTIHEHTAQLINRQYSLKVFEEALGKLKQHQIKTVVHLIFGLPFESKKDMLDSVHYLSSKDIFGIKLHLLHVLKHTKLAKMYQLDQFSTLKKEAYISLIVDALEILHPEITIHRLTGDAPWKHLVAPKWSTDKRGILNGIDAELKRRKSWQGIKFL